MSNSIRSFSYKDDKKIIIEKLEEIATKERLKFSEIVMDCFEEYVKKHGASNNPQTVIEQFDKESVLAIPNVYRDFQSWKKFYSLIKKKEDYAELDKQLNMILNLHNKKVNEF